ncbi:MAG: hypothetical protein DI537_05435 [Stutzerimonas stutzeri]|nr:MAG: hypothetical protein DI537_05435 [Stutzerimonas stutzeri]
MTEINTQRQLSDVAIDSGLVILSAAAAAVGVSAAPPAFLGMMGAASVARRYWPAYHNAMANAAPVLTRINQTRMGARWSEYVSLRQQAAAEKKASIGGALKKAWLLYGLTLGAAAYWTMPFILGVAGRILSGQYLVILLLIVLHHLSIFAQYAEIRAWARKRSEQRRVAT